MELKATFDCLKRELIWDVLKKKELEGKLFNILKMIYKETSSRVRVGEKLTERFWVCQGVKQGCILSPLLFSLVISELDAWLNKSNEGGVVVGSC